jgi:hypothetical protein
MSSPATGPSGNPVSARRATLAAVHRRATAAASARHPARVVNISPRYRREAAVPHYHRPRLRASLIISSSRSVGRDLRQIRSPVQPVGGPRNGKPTGGDEMTCIGRPRRWQGVNGAWSAQRRCRSLGQTAALRKTTGAAHAQTHAVMTGSPACAWPWKPGGGWGGVNRSFQFMWCQRVISNTMTIQLPIQRKALADSRRRTVRTLVRVEALGVPNIKDHLRSPGADGQTRRMRSQEIIDASTSPAPPIASAWFPGGQHEEQFSSHGPNRRR